MAKVTGDQGAVIEFMSAKDTFKVYSSLKTVVKIIHFHHKGT